MKTVCLYEAERKRQDELDGERIFRSFPAVGTSRSSLMSRGGNARIARRSRVAQCPISNCCRERLHRVTTPPPREGVVVEINGAVAGRRAPPAGGAPAGACALRHSRSAAACMSALWLRNRLPCGGTICMTRRIANRAVKCSPEVGKTTVTTSGFSAARPAPI